MTSCHNKLRHRRTLAAVLLLIMLSPFPWVSQGTRVLAQEQTHRTEFTKNSDATRGTDLTYGRASLKSRGVLIEWRSKPNPDNLGFNIYRLQAGHQNRINEHLIPGVIFAGVRSPAPPSEYSFVRFDASGTADSIYYIESVSLDGQLKSHEAIVPVRGWLESSDRTAQEPGSAAASSTENSPPSEKGFPTGSDQINLPSGPIEDQWAIAAQSGLKIHIKSDGWYRVTQQQMATAGFNPVVDIRNLSLFVDGREVAIRTNKDAGQLTSADFIEFYGRGIDIATTDTKIYYLIAGTTPGKRTGGGIQSDSDPKSPLPLSSAALTPPVVPSQNRWFGWLLQFLNGSDDAVSARVGGPPEVSLRGPTASPGVEKVTPTEPEGSVSDPAEDKAAAPLAVREILSHPKAPSSESVKQEQAAIAMADVTIKKGRVRKNRGKSKHKGRRQHSHVMASAAAAVAVSFSYTVLFRERLNYIGNLLNGDLDNYFGNPVFSSVTQTVSAPNPEFSADGPAKLEVALQGIQGQFFPNHTVSVSFNGTLMTTFTFGPLDHPVQTINIPVAQIINGANTVTFTRVSSGDVSLIDYVRLTYPHALKADNNALRFSLRSAQAAKIDGFTSQNIRLIDYSDPFAVKLTRPITEPTASGYAINVSPGPRNKAARLLYAIPETQIDQPAAFSLNQPSTLNATTNGADLVIVAHKTLIASAAPLVSLRQSQGRLVSVVDIEDVYDEFSYGTHRPQAIKDFLARAKSSWTTKPKYVIFLGDADLDPRNYEGVGNFDLVPTKLVDATYNETASDDWLTDFDNDGIGEIPAGRLPVRTPAEANLAISKIVNFAPTNAPQSALLVADDHTNPPYYFNFETASDELVAFLPASMTVQKIYRRLQSSNCVARANIINAMNQGVAVVNYSGHGNVNIWAGSCPPGSMFETGDAQTLTNSNRLPLVIVTNCLNGYFQDPRLEGIAEGFVKAQLGGAVAVFASSGETIPDGQHAMSNRLYALLYGSQPITLGDAIKDAKGQTTDIDVRRTWIFFGDPSMKIR